MPRSASKESSDSRRSTDPAVTQEIETGLVIDDATISVVYRVARSLCRWDAELANDLAQTVLMRALEHPPPRAHPNLKAWFRCVLRNLLYDEYRRTRRENANQLPSPVEGDEIETRLHLTRQVRQLSAKERTMVELLADGLSVIEVAKRMGCHRSTIHRHIRNLRDRYEGTCPISNDTSDNDPTEEE